MHVVVQPTFPGHRHNSPRAETLCSDVAGLTALPPALFVADEAGITVTVDGGGPSPVRAFIAIGAYGDFSKQVCLIAHVPGLGMIDHSHEVDLSGTVADAITRCATAFGASIAQAALDAQKSAELVVLDHRGDVLVDAPCRSAGTGRSAAAAPLPRRLVR